MGGCRALRRRQCVGPKNRRRRRGVGGEVL